MNKNIVINLDPSCYKVLVGCNLTNKASGVASVNSNTIQLRVWENNEGTLMCEGVKNWNAQHGSLIINTCVVPLNL